MPLIIIGSIIVIQTAQPGLLAITSFGMKNFNVSALTWILFPIIGIVLILIGIVTKIPADPTGKNVNPLSVVAGGLMMWFSLYIFSWTFSVLFVSFSYQLLLIVLFLFGLNASGAYLIYHSYRIFSPSSKSSISPTRKKYITPALSITSFIIGVVFQFVILSLTQSVANCNNGLACFGILFIIPIIVAMLPLTYLLLYHGYIYFTKTSYKHLSLIIGICFSTLALYAVNMYYSDPKFIGDFSIVKILTQSVLLLLSTVGVYITTGVIFTYLARSRSV